MCGTLYRGVLSNIWCNYSGESLLQLKLYFCIAIEIEISQNEDTDDPNLDMWLRLYMRYNFNENQESGMLAKFCEPVFIPRGTP